MAVLLATVSGVVQSQSVPNCTISGQPGVIASTGTTPQRGDPVYTLNYVEGQLVYDADGPTGGSSVVGNQNTEVLQLPGFGLTFSKLKGNPGFNHGVFNNHWGTACGTLVDTNGDGQANEIVMQMGAYAGRGGMPVITSFPLSTVQPGNTLQPDVTYWPLRILPSWTPYSGPLNFFTPVAGKSISLSCPGLSLAADPQTNARSPGPCVNDIPTATFWGYAALTLLMLFSGMRLLRKGGFGNDFNLRA